MKMTRVPSQDGSFTTLSRPGTTTQKRMADGADTTVSQNIFHLQIKNIRSAQGTKALPGQMRKGSQSAVPSSGQKTPIR